MQLGITRSYSGLDHYPSLIQKNFNLALSLVGLEFSFDFLDGSQAKSLRDHLHHYIHTNTVDSLRSIAQDLFEKMDRYIKQGHSIG
jgi:hypothetical protein